MPKKQIIPAEIQEEVQKLIDELNRVNLKESTALLSAFFSKRLLSAFQREISIFGSYRLL
jgi:hypothetical protein